MPSVLQPFGHVSQFRGGGGVDGTYGLNVENAVSLDNFGNIRSSSVAFDAGTTMVCWADGMMRVFATYRPDSLGGGQVICRVRLKASGDVGIGSIVASETIAGTLAGQNVSFQNLGPFAVVQTDLLVVTFEPDTAPGFVRGSLRFVYD